MSATIPPRVSTSICPLPQTPPHPLLLVLFFALNRLPLPCTEPSATLSLSGSVVRARRRKSIVQFGLVDPRKLKSSLSPQDRCQRVEERVILEAVFTPEEGGVSGVEEESRVPTLETQSSGDREKSCDPRSTDRVGSHHAWLHGSDGLRRIYSEGARISSTVESTAPRCFFRRKFSSSVCCKTVMSSAILILASISSCVREVRE
jgi:hypothetical protein